MQGLYGNTLCNIWTDLEERRIDCNSSVAFQQSVKISAEILKGDRLVNPSSSVSFCCSLTWNSEAHDSVLKQLLIFSKIILTF